MSSRPRGALVTPALLVLALLVALRATGQWVARRAGLEVILGVRFWVVATLLLASVAVLAFASWDALRRPREPYAALRSLFSCAVPAWVLFLIAVQPFQRLWFDAVVGIALGCWGHLVAFTRDDRPPSKVGLAVFSLCLAVVLLEVGLRAVAAVSPGPLFVRTGDAPAKMLERFRCRPGQVRFGFPCNELGYYDEPFAAREDGERLAAVIGDSFSVGSVPHDRHYTTLAERELGFPVANVGVAGTGTEEYLHMLVTDVLPLDPDVVVFALFVGNDLTVADLTGELPDQALRAWLERDRVLLSLVPRRLLRISAERRNTGHGRVARVQGEELQESAEAELPWLDDPSLEEPTLSREAWLRLETERVLDVCAGTPRSLDVVFRSLRAARTAAKGRHFAVLLIPDEAQVEDPLWAELEERIEQPLDRDLPQRLLADWLEREGIPHADLLPALRAVPPLDDGWRRVYHLQDTHFNARGNAVAASVLAELVRGSTD